MVQRNTSGFSREDKLTQWASVLVLLQVVFGKINDLDTYIGLLVFTVF